MAFAALKNYIDQYFYNNGIGLIEGDNDNYALTSLLDFISKSPLNWEKVLVVSSGGVITASRPVTIFISTAVTSLTWPENIYNQYVFINSTNSAIPFSGGVSYYDINLIMRTSIPAKTAISIYKSANDLWIGLPFNTNGSSGVSYDKLQFEIGAVGSPMVAGDTELVISVDNPKNNSEFVFLDGSLLFEDRNDRISYTIVYTATQITITFNQGVSNGQLYLIKYAKS